MRENKMSDFKDKFYKKVSDKNGIIIGKYINGRRKVQVKCGNGHVWKAKPFDVSRGKWCPVCNKSKGETNIENVLKKWNVKYICEYRDPEMYKLHKRKCRYDFYFTMWGNQYVIEFDGLQHFEQSEWFGDSKAKFGRRRGTDKFKTKYAISHGIKVIRISYKEEDKIEEHMLLAVASTIPVYVSNPDMYAWIFK
ncbi:homing endonuclease [Orpheovirus IHUMI-LCC2]|uniref:Endonuclease n=1 Tax=Orpheovirus IHUMI-LCC2 TaxID=2023057 RepID=A0A2I2L3U9_9VIRU|nr:homing endonuclease [Orpheovirus IHUMI-LCC2]SNW62235.1 Putative endonuclease [Orpheovirus IHUMI-LCC2]